MADKDPSVLVIGAGMAGLAAGCHLINGGMSRVTVLEADNRVGGRIHSVRFGENGGTGDPAMVELGATWIHGKGPISELAETFNLIDNGLVQDEYDGMYVSSNGTKCAKELVRKAKEEFGKIIEELYEKKVSVSCAALYPTILAYIQYRLEQVLDTLPSNDREEFEDIFKSLMKVKEENHGTAVGDISVHIPGTIILATNTILAGGYSALITRLIHRITDKRIHLLTNVTNIDYTNPKEVKVHCQTENGAKMYTADHVIVTTSLGVLKQDHQNLFSPSLPHQKIQSIAKLGYGIVNKIILYYKTPFWNLGEGMKLVWRNGNAESNKSLPGWARCLYCINSMATNPNTLDVWLCGEEGKKIETIPNDVIARVLTTVLRRFLNDPSLPEPDSILKTSWYSNRLFRGSYPYARVGSTVDGIHTLATPLVDKDNKPVVLFAGDATDDYFAMTHGSLNSGIREANRLLMRK